MQTALLRPRATTNSLENEHRRAGWWPWSIESAGEPVSVSPDSTPASGVTPDAFGASLLDPNTNPPLSLVQTVDQTTDSFYTRDVADGVTQGQAAMGVTVSPPSGTPAVVSVDISSPAAGQAAEILFRLIGGGDPSSSSTVTISDVKVVTGSTPAVPERGAFLLASLGILGGLGYARRLQRGRPLETRGHARSCSSRRPGTCPAGADGCG